MEAMKENAPEIKFLVMDMDQRNNRFVFINVRDM